jgi:hypothetical protein
MEQLTKIIRQLVYHNFVSNITWHIDRGANAKSIISAINNTQKLLCVIFHHVIDCSTFCACAVCAGKIRILSWVVILKNVSKPSFLSRESLT